MDEGFLPSDATMYKSACLVCLSEYKTTKDLKTCPVDGEILFKFTRYRSADSYTGKVGHYLKAFCEKMCALNEELNFIFGRNVTVTAAQLEDGNILFTPKYQSPEANQHS